MVVITLMAVCMVVLASLGLGFITPDKPIEFLGMNIAKSDGQFIPPVVGAFAFAGGVIFRLAKTRHA